jgi:hypothetical protein
MDNPDQPDPAAPVVSAGSPLGPDADEQVKQDIRGLLVGADVDGWRGESSANSVFLLNAATTGWLAT